MAPHDNQSIVNAIRTLNLVQTSNIPISLYDRIYSIWDNDGPYKSRYLVEQLLDSITGIHVKVFQIRLTQN